jgi:hypothetical protein
MWIYSQGFATLYYQASVDGPLTEVAKGYSGRGVGRNDPTYQCNEEWGPLPIGKYTIEEPKKGPTPYSLPLEPDPTNDMCDPPRENFLIHGDKATEPPEIPYVASHGCIILPRPTRQKIWESGDHELLVVRFATET